MFCSICKIKNVRYETHKFKKSHIRNLIKSFSKPNGINYMRYKEYYVD